MPRIAPVRTSEAPPKSKTLLEGVSKKLGITPNIMATMGHSPAVLQAYLGFGQALSGASISDALREQIALAVAGENACGYCAAAHTAIAKGAGVDDDEATRNLRGTSDDTRVQAALDFSRAIVAERGWVKDDAVAAVRAAGFSDAEIVEIIATVAINLFTNYFNHIVQTDIDFPAVDFPTPVNA